MATTTFELVKQVDSVRVQRIIEGERITVPAHALHLEDSLTKEEQLVRVLEFFGYQVRGSALAPVCGVYKGVGSTYVPPVNYICATCQGKGRV